MALGYIHSIGLWKRCQYFDALDRVDAKIRFKIAVQADQIYGIACFLADELKELIRKDRALIDLRLRSRGCEVQYQRGLVYGRLCRWWRLIWCNRWRGILRRIVFDMSVARNGWFYVLSNGRRERASLRQPDHHTGDMSLHIEVALVNAHRCALMIDYSLDHALPGLCAAFDSCESAVLLRKLG